MEIILTHVVLAIILFFLINWIGEHSVSIGYTNITLFNIKQEAPALNFLIRVLTPLIYLLIVAAGLYAINLDRYVVNFYNISIYYILFRLLFNIVTGRLLLLNWIKQIIYWIAITLLSILIYEKIIRFKHNLLPDFSSIANELWIIIIVFVFQVLNGLNLSTSGAESRQQNYLAKQYQHFSKKYGNLIKKNTDNVGLEIISYAILIHENYNRPRVYRWCEYFLFSLSGKKRSLGVMQYQTTKHINDEQSVDLGTKKIAKAYITILDKVKTKKEVYYNDSNVSSEIISDYNGGFSYSEDVESMVELIKNKFYKKAPTKLFPFVLNPAQ